MSLEEEALKYHSEGRKGKIEVNATKPCLTAKDLSLAYSPGVAVPCVHIAHDPAKVYEYTAKGNLVGVISNGTAVLGLGDIGPLASKPVMEGKGILFKKFADIDVFDIEINAKTPEEIISVCKALEPTFGGINLEDIKAPECFLVEETLKKELKIPVFHDDQHGTAVITTAAFINAVEIAKKKIEKMRIVFSGAGSAAIACANLLISMGAKIENIIICDSKGVIYKERGEGMNKYKQKFAVDTKLRTLEEALKKADAFIGVSVAGILKPHMLKSMAKTPIIFAMANPTPEILPEEAKKIRSDAIIATGRSDYPNQVNNVLCFPYIFRGALDVRATTINEEMKMAAVRALADLAKEPVPKLVSNAYGGTNFKFGPEYLIPKPFDPRVLQRVSLAVAKAAIQSNVAQKPFKSDYEYLERLEQLQGTHFIMVMRSVRNTIIKRLSRRKSLPTIVFPEGENEKILRACSQIRKDRIAKPILLGNPEGIRAVIEKLGLRDLRKVQIIDPIHSEKLDNYIRIHAIKRERKGVTFARAQKLMKRRNYFGPMMVEMGDADGIVNGITQSYPDTIRPMLNTIGPKKGQRLAGIYIVVLKSRLIFFSDTTVNIKTTSEELAHIAIETADLAQMFLQSPPKVAMLSFSNFGSAKSEEATKVRNAVQIAQIERPDLIIDGEMQVDPALNPEIAKRLFPFSKIQGDANVLIFPELASANISYKLLHLLGDADLIGPILIGMNKPVNVLQYASEEQDIVNMAAITALNIQFQNEKHKSVKEQLDV